MKKIITLCLLFMGIGAMAQNAPQGISYQAIARDASGAVMAGQAVTVRFRLFSSFGSGTPAYEETHSVSTNALGYFNLVIGQGAPVTGSFGAVNWSTGNASYEVYLNGTLLGSETRFFSTPYALYAQQAGGATAYTAGTGIAINSGTITNTAPDQAVSITGTNGTSVTGAYPNYTVSSDSYQAGGGIAITSGSVINTAPDQPVSITGTNGTNVTGAYPNYTVSAGSYQAGSGIAITSGSVINTSPNQTVSVTGTNVTGAYPNYTVTAGTAVPTGTANGNTMWWSVPLSAWQQSGHLYNDNQHVGIGIGSLFSGKLHVHSALNADSSVIFSDHMNAVARTAGVRSFISGTSALGQFNTAIMGGNFFARNLGQGPAVGMAAIAESSVAGGTAIGLYSTTYGTASNRWSAMFDGGGVKISDSLVLGGGGATGYILTRSSSGRAIWTNPSAVSGDNLGNHTMLQNLNTNGFYLSGNGTASGIFIDPSNRVAIGAATAFSNLDVNGNIRAAGSRLFLGPVSGFNNGYTGIYENGGDMTLAVYRSVGGSTAFGVNTLDAVMLKANTGFMGVGTPAPQYRLHVRGGIHADSLLNMNGVTGLPPLSPAGQGRLAFDGLKFKVSENGGPYVNLVGSQPVQFSAYGCTSTFAPGSVIAVPFQNIDYNVGGGFNGTVFTVPVAGLYHFDGMVTLNTSSVSGGDYQLQIMNGGGSYRTAIVQLQGGQNIAKNQISVDLMLNVGDQIQLGVYNGASSAIPVYTSAISTYFTGHKVN